MAWDFPVKRQTPAEPQITKEIHEWIKQELIESGRDNNVNRASSATNCVRQRWYKANGYDGDPLNPRSIITFGFGDLTEHWMKDLVKKACVGPGRLYSEIDFGKPAGSFRVQHREFQDYEQETLNIEIPDGPKVTGHADGWAKRNEDGQWELLEIKSSADLSYKGFLQGETPDYIKQAHALLLSDKAKALGAKSVRFLYMNKNTSHITDRVYQFDARIARQVIEEFKLAVGEKIPERPEMDHSIKGGVKTLYWKCSYCPFTKTCWPNATMSFNKNGNPTWSVRITKEEE